MYIVQFQYSQAINSPPHVQVSRRKRQKDRGASTVFTHMVRLTGMDMGDLVQSAGGTVAADAVRAIVALGCTVAGTKA